METRPPPSEAAAHLIKLQAGRRSALRDLLKAERRREEAAMSPEERVLLACELSDLCLLLREACSREPSS
jgi:hypothetical protein